MERISSLAKDTRTKALEYLVIKLGYDPSDIQVAKEMIKRKNVDIQALRKQLKLPYVDHPQAKEIIELELEKENLSKLIVEKNVQIQKMETDMEILLKEKEELATMVTDEAHQQVYYMGHNSNFHLIK